MNAVVVGGSHGIGAGMVKRLKNAGYSVHSFSRTQDEQADQWTQWDAESSNFPESALPEEIDAFAYCPGTIDLKPFHRIKSEQFEKEMKINFFGAVNATQACLDGLKKAEGSAVYFSTVAVKQGMPFHAGIASAKGAIEGLTRSLAAEYAPKVRFNVIAPSLTDTPLAERLLANDAKREASDQRHPLKRVGSIDDLSGAATFLLGKESSWITGQVLGVDGGMSSIRPI